MRYVYIVRHGQTDSNKVFACIGHKDVPLNDEGHAQAESLAKRLEKLSFDKIYTSPLLRARETIAPFLADHDIEMNICGGLIERDFGDWDDMNFKQISKKFPKLYKEWRDDPFEYEIPGGESDKLLYERVGQTVHKILEDTSGDILIVTHLCVARHIISHLLELEPHSGKHFFLANTGIAKIGLHSGGSSVLEGLNI